MPKTDFSKAEDSFSESLRKFNVDKLWTETEKKKKTTEDEEKKQLLIALQFDLKRLHRHNPDFYKKIGKTKKEIANLLAHPDALEESQWEEIKKIKTQIDLLIEEASKQAPLLSNDELIKEERRKHINKRFNVNDKWLPLH